MELTRSIQSLIQSQLWKRIRRRNLIYQTAFIVKLLVINIYYKAIIMTQGEVNSPKHV